MEAIYARQSLDKKDSLSIEAQIELCKKQASEDCKVFRDKGFSGKNTNRPAFEELLAQVQQGKISKIYVYRLDRFSRSLADFGRVWQLLEQYGVEFESISERFDTTSPMGRAMLNIIMTFAQLERETIAQRVRDNYYHRFSLGSWPGGPAPLGYDIGRLIAQDGRQIPCLTPNEKLETIISLFHRYADSDISLGELARRLNEEGVEGTKRGAWDNVRLGRILKNPVYVMADEDVYWYYKSQGLEIAQPVEEFIGLNACNLVGKRSSKTGRRQGGDEQRLSLANHSGCVDSALFLRCQHKLEHNRQLSRGNFGKHSWLSGLLKCKSCGYAVKINKQGDRLYLLCSGRSNLRLCEESLRIDLRALERELQEKIEGFLKSCPDAWLEDSGRDDYSGGLAALDMKIERLVAALSESSEISMPYINQEIARLDEMRKRLNADREIARKRRPAGSALDFARLSLEEKQLTAGFFIEKILLSGETAEVLWRV